MKRLYALILILGIVASLLVFKAAGPIPIVEAQGGGCTQTATVSLASGTTVVLVSGAGGGMTVVCGFVLTADTLATTAQLKSGTGALCATGTVNFGGAMRFVDEGNISFERPLPIWQASPATATAASPDICITSATGAITGFLIYGRN